MRSPAFLGDPRFLLRVVAGLLAGGVTASGAFAATPVSRSTPAIGLHAGKDDSIAQYEAFGDWLGRKVLYRVVFSDWSSWNGIASPWYLGATRKWLESDPRRVEVISLPLMPQHEKGAFAAIATGEHDGSFRAFGEVLQARGYAHRVIVRLAWEGNGDWYPWAYASDPAGFRAAFRRAAQTMKQAAPGLRIEWCVAARASRKGGPARWTEGYPGDDVVDIISMDVYDEYNPNWDSLLNGEAGLRELREFAIARGKPEAYPEWGCSTNPKALGGGDNIEFVEGMAAWFEGRPGEVIYQAYWNTSSGGPNGAIFSASALLVPNAAAAYRSLFGSTAAPSHPRLD